MSYKRTLISISAFLLLSTILGLFLFSNRKTDLGKNKSLRPYNETTIRTHKLNRPINVSITSDKITPLELGAQFQLKAQISVDASLKNAQYSWKIPDGVDRISGDSTGAINLEVDDSFEINTQFINNSTENKVIFLIISDTKNIIYSEQFHTQDHEKIKAELAELKERQELDGKNNFK